MIMQVYSVQHAGVFQLLFLQIRLCKIYLNFYNSWTWKLNIFWHRRGPIPKEQRSALHSPINALEYLFEIDMDM